MSMSYSAAVLIFFLGASEPAVPPLGETPKVQAQPSLDSLPRLQGDRMIHGLFQPSPPSPEEEMLPLYLGVRHEKLFEQMGIVYTRRSHGPSGVSYIREMAWQEKKAISGVHLAVYTNADFARRAYTQVVWMVPVGPSEGGGDIGTSFALWGGERGGGTMLIRERNIVISYRWGGDSEQAKHNGRRIVELIRSDREIAPMGRFDNPPPGLVCRQLMSWPGRNSNSCIVCPEVQGMGDPDTLLFSSSLGPMPDESLRFPGFPTGGSWCRKLPEGRIEAHCRDETTLQLHIVSEDNLLVTQEIELMPRPPAPPGKPELPGLSYASSSLCSGDEMSSQPSCPPLPGEESEEIYLGLRHDRLFDILNHTWYSRSVEILGVEYSTNPRSTVRGVEVRKARLAVHRTRYRAAEEFDRAVVSKWEWPSEHGPEIGTYFALSGDGMPTYTLLILEENILLSLDCFGVSEQVRSLAERIVERIRSDQELAPRGRFDPVPRLVNKQLRQLCRSGSDRGVWIRIRPLFEGLGAPENIMVCVQKEGPDISGIDSPLTSDSRLEFREPHRGIPEPLFLLAANEDNVYIIEEATILPIGD